MTESFTVTRTFAAPVQLVWDAWTKPEHFAVWFGTEAVEVPLDSVTLDVRTGGALKATMLIPGGPTINWEGEYTQVDPLKRIEFTLSDNPGEVPGIPVVAVFTEVDGGTEVSLTQDRGDFGDEQVAATVAGYNSFFDSLERVVATLEA
jgi:uncharacterized protein YndB with AHSA1/START domain